MRKFFSILIVLWTVIVVSAFLSNFYVLHKSSEANVRANSDAFFDFLMNVPQWNGYHKAIFVPVTETVKPNPYYTGRHDVVTTSGDSLTSLITAIILRELSDITQKGESTKFRIVSLKPIRPENIADEWETKALQTIKNDDDRFYEKVKIGDTATVNRYMIPFIASKGCLNCHAAQGFKVGDVLGGISVDTPDKGNYFTNAGISITGLVIVYLLIYLVGFFSMLLVKIVQGRQKTSS